MTMQDQGIDDAPEPVAPDAPTQGGDGTDEPAAPEPPVPPLTLDAIKGALTGEFRTVQGELRRQQAEFTRVLQQPRTQENAQVLADLSARMEDTSQTVDLLVNALLPEEQRAALNQQRDMARLKRENARLTAPRPAAAPAPPFPDTTPQHAQAALARVQVSVQSYAEALGLDVTTLTPAEQEQVQQNVPTDDLAALERAVKANLKAIAQQRTNPATASQPAPAARAPAPAPATTTPASRGAGGGRPRDLAAAERMLAQDEISVAQFRAWGFS